MTEKKRKPREMHGMTHTPEYASWEGIEQRCYNPNDRRYADYGGRGITRDPAWDAFTQFYADMGPRPAGMSLDRIDNDGPYSAANCRWATPSQQMTNRRPPKLSEACGKGHPYTPENTHYRGDGSRLCKPCARAAERARYWRKKAAS